MRDDLANLQVLVLPGGATTGERIVLDGIDGEIEFYDDVNRLVMRLNGSFIIRILPSVIAQTIISSRPDGEAQDMFIISGDGGMAWGGGAAIIDTFFFREDVATMRIQENLQVDGEIRNLIGEKIFHTGTFNGSTTTVSGQTGCLTVTHGAGFQPSFVIVQPTSPASGGNIFVGHVVRDALSTNTVFVVRFINQAGAAPDGVTIDGHYVCFP
jgi:hypothetical protein